MNAKRILAAAAALPLALLGAALVLDFEARALGRAVMDEARSVTGLTLEAEDSRFHLLGGLSLEGVRCSSDFGIGGYEARFERIVFRHRLLSLLRGRLSLKEVALEEPRVTLQLEGRRGEARSQVRPFGGASQRRDPSGPASEKARPGASSLQVDFIPSAFRIVGGGVVLRDRFSIEGLDLTLGSLAYDRRAITPLHALTARGSMSIREVGIDALRLRDLSANLSTGSGRFRLEALRLSSDRGSVEGEIDVNFNSIPFRYQTSLTGELRIAGLAPSTLRFEAEGFGTDGENLRGAGTLALGPGKFPDAPWVRLIEPELIGRDHAPAEIRFEVRDGRVDLETFELASPPYVLEIGGSLALDGSTLPEFTLRRGDGSGGPRSAPRAARTGTAPRRE